MRRERKGTCEKIPTLKTLLFTAQLNFIFLKGKIQAKIDDPA